MKIEKLQKKYISEVCDIDIENRQRDFLVILGKTFLNFLYDKIIVKENKFCFAAFEKNKVTGFLLGSKNSKALLKEIVLQNWVKISFILFPVVLKNPAIIFKIFQTLSYTNKLDQQHAELIVIGVNPQFRGKGIATQLIKEFEKALLSFNIDKYRVVANAGNLAANKLYESNGFIMKYDFSLYGKLLKCYEKHINRINFKR